MNRIPSFADAVRAVYLEALHIDQRNWEAWLALYLPECRFWVPSWRDEGSQVEDPEAGISFIYASCRTVLEERVRRIVSGKSITTLPMPRTVHAVSNPVQLPAAGDGTLRLSTAWTNHIYNPRTSQSLVLFGRYEHELVEREAGCVQIASKKVILVNDQVPTVLDIYSV
jgi:3-phenylpropionate/cinnamic acid dioxygenase small subunit